MVLRDIINNFNRTIKRYDMIPAGSTVIAGVSGGADSVCLLLLLCEYRCNNKFNLVAAHYNHKLRGDEADGDEEFTKKLCKTLKVEYVSGAGDVLGYAKEHGIGTEEAARFLRYEFFMNEAKKRLESNPDIDVKIAVAHNQNDRAETILHNIARGTSLEGLKGISYIRGNIIRPLLNITRAETEYICNAYGVMFRIDSTNIDCKYQRNRIRGNVIPYLENQLGDDFVKNMLRMSDLASEDNRYIKDMAEKAYTEMVHETVYKNKKNNKIEINTSHFVKEDKVIQARIIRRTISSIKDKEGNFVFPDGTGLGFVTTQRAIEYILRKKTGGYIEIGKGVYCYYSYGKAVFSVEKKKINKVVSVNSVLMDSGTFVVDDFDIALYEKVKKLCIEAENTDEVKSIQTATEIGDMIYDVEIEVVPKASMDDIYEVLHDSKYACFDSCEFFKFCDEHGIPVIRTKRKEDEFRSFGMRGGKKLNRFLMDCKIPVAERDEIPIVASGNRVMWIYDLRRSNIAPVQNDSSSVIIITLTK